MKINSSLYVTAIALVTLFSCCKKDNQNGGFENNGNFTDTTATLKSVAPFPIGIAAEYPLSSTNAGYWSVVRSEASNITFGNELKNDAVLKGDGSYDFTRADAFYNLATTAGLQVFGHTLVWHSQQRASYYNTLIGGGNSGGVTNLVSNPGFETTTVNTPAEPADGWSVLNGVGQFTSTSTNTNSGAKALQINVPAGGQSFNTQIANKTQIPVSAGKTYIISYSIKGTGAQSIQLEIRPFLGAAAGSVNYQGGLPVTTSYAKNSYSYVVPANVTAIQIAFDLGGTSNTLYLDDVSITDAAVVAPPTGAAMVSIVDNAMKKHIETVVGHYVGKIKAWDVINEPFSDAGELRNNTNTPSTGRTDIFVWQNYLGRDYATKAFQYAKAADASADFYMNDYNLESSTAKLDAFVKLANELKAANAGITGVGTQMHMLISTPYANIISMMQKLAATGLKVKISELDIRINPGGANPAVGYSASAYDLRLQAAMYKFVIATYIKYVPAAQRGGITIWGVDDSSSWLNTSANVTANRLDYPLLFDKNFSKKPAYAGVKQALQGNGEN
jgi:endo-1,4-beta-xylanase